MVFSRYFRPLLLCLALAFSSAHAATMLVYGPTAGCYADSTPGYVVTIWSAGTWASKTTADFAAFDVIVFGGCPGNLNASIWNTAVTTASVWGPAISGNKVIMGTDPDDHGQV